LCSLVSENKKKIVTNSFSNTNTKTELKSIYRFEEVEINLIKTTSGTVLSFKYRKIGFALTTKIVLRSSCFQRCQKHVTLVTMKDLGWEKWIIAPTTFEAGFCSGKCPNPLPKEMHPSNHALLQSLLHSSTVPAVCCSPDQMRSMTLFYRDELGRSTIKNFENMIVESCTCQ
uniref:TGF_BETA_2 domain-containing protein n=1 Tax=Angiostrongylus cantonensis TaxID=6313 RepID=A0A0K0D3Q1_ANGCA